MKSIFKSILIISCFALIISCSKEVKTENDFTQYVDPFIGTGGHGHTFPGACLPFGMVQLSPDNEKQGWDWCSGYHVSDSIIIQFSHTHLSGTGCGDLQDIGIMPTTNEVKEDTTRNGRNFIYQFKSAFSHENETAKPGYYSVVLDDSKIKAELTATLRAGFHKYTFPKSENSKIIIDLDCKGGWDKMIESGAKIEDETTVSGYTFSNGWATNQKVYFVAKFSKPFKKFYTSATGELNEGIKEMKGRSTKAILCFTTDENESVLVKVGISSSGVEGAMNNLNTEIKDWNFDAVAKNASEEWNKELSKFKVESKDQDQIKIFYTAVYHSMVSPNTYSDVDGQYTGIDGKMHQAKGFTNYYTFSLWDTFRAMHPLYTIVDEQRVSEMIQAMMAHYREFGILPMWSLWGNETYCMIGYHSIPVITDAYFKGIKGFDANEAFEAMKKTAMAEVKDREYKDLDLYIKYGYFPVDKQIERTKANDETVSKTLEWAYDDWCIAQMAKALNKTEDYNYFSKRANNFINVADSTTGFMRPRYSDGKWLTPFDPTLVQHGNGYVEGNAWQYSWFVPHDVPSLIQIMGGNKKFTTKLDSLFLTKSKSKVEVVDVTGLMGQYAHGNEPSHHVAYLYSYAGQPWKTQQMVCLVRDSLYKSTRDGLCGNDDCGQMSAWYVFSAMGFYPVNPADGIYVIGSPLFEKVVVNVGNNKVFTVTAKNISKKNIYIQSASLNGKALETCYITHKNIMEGGKLEFVMGDKPNLNLWKDEKALPSKN
ncbi:MAG: GH92 family glycosyl hydrolase [Bacteroidales bacterium]